MAPQLNLPVGYLRAFVTLLVVAHHAVLAYHPFAPATRPSLLSEPRWWQAFPVVDAQRSVVVALFTGWNDVFFMALMFFLSGLFVSGSLARKGARHFLGDRLRRLGIPFLVGAALAPLAYYPAYLTSAAPEGISGFAREWLALGTWPAGPAWFLWVLLAFGVAAAALQALLPGYETALARRLVPVLERPALGFALLLVVSAAAYLPLALAFNPIHWTAFGPFFFQTSRILLYAVYFFGGGVVGALGLEHGLLTADGRLARRWPAWVAAAVAAFALHVVVALRAAAAPADAALQAKAALAFVLSCAASSFALLAVFLRFATRSSPARESLRENAYGVYVVHYAFVSWLQLALLEAPLPAMAKGTAAFVLAALLSWGTTAALRRSAAVRRVL